MSQCRIRPVVCRKLARLHRPLCDASDHSGRFHGTSADEFILWPASLECRAGFYSGPVAELCFKRPLRPPP
ncbi:hypothetical protein NDU88_002337 [Pleurodeles waltl]|uniref:Uncharacterized protein n=1 Tax=Pleurodeles waltl TaxID=8319 RepID=A0AAV7VZ31_PLEWA|nr:hypothetical protein NDU88_002337 [Pleurodeles waltl]